MGKALLLTSLTNNDSANGREFTFANSIGISSCQVSRYQFVARIPGLMSKLGVLVPAIDAGRVVRYRRNGGNGNQVVSPTDTTAGLFEDNTHTDAVTPGDLISLAHALTGVGLTTYYWQREVFTAAGDHACLYFAAGQNIIAAGSTNYWSISGTRSNNNIVEANVQTLMRAGGVFANLQVFASINSASGSTTAVSRINGANGNQSITIGAGLTGRFEDNGNTDAITSGDLLDIAVAVGAGTGSITWNGAMGGTIANAAGPINDLFATQSGGTTRAASATPGYYFFAGEISADTTEANRKVRHGFAVTTSNLRLRLSANTYSQPATVGMRKNGADGRQTITIGAGLTGVFEDASHYDAFAANDDADVAIVGGGSGSITLRWIGLTEGEYEAPGRISPELFRSALVEQRAAEAVAAAA